MSKTILMPTLLARLFLGLGLFSFWGAIESKILLKRIEEVLRTTWW
jgi:hypothetical protein